MTKLNEKVSMLESDVAALNESYDELQQEARQQQANFDAALSQVHYLIADKKQLTSLGLLKNGKIKTDNLDLDLFVAVDARDFTNVSIQGSRPKILTAMPASAYELKQNTDGTSVLVINDISAFWKASKVLIIQVR